MRGQKSPRIRARVDGTTKVIYRADFGCPSDQERIAVHAFGPNWKDDSRDAMKVLVVNSDPQRVKSLALELQHDGWEPLQATTYEEAKRLLKNVIYLSPASAAAYVELGALYARDGERDRARTMWVTALELLRQLPSETPLGPWNPAPAGEWIRHMEAQLAEGD